jgi:hypothetical protein
MTDVVSAFPTCREIVDLAVFGTADSGTVDRELLLS